MLDIYFQLSTICLKLSDLWQVAVNLLNPSSPKGGHLVQMFSEIIFSYFFPSSSSTYDLDDCLWFLSHANSQNHWLSPSSNSTSGVNDAQHTVQKSSIYKYLLYLSRILHKHCGERDAGSDSLALFRTNVICDF